MCSWWNLEETETPWLSIQSKTSILSRNTNILRFQTHPSKFIHNSQLIILQNWGFKYSSPSKPKIVVNNLWLLLKSVPSVWRAQSCWQPLKTPASQPWSPDRRLIKQKATETTTSSVSCRNSEAFEALLEKRCQTAKPRITPPWPTAAVDTRHKQNSAGDSLAMVALKMWTYEWHTERQEISMSAYNFGHLSSSQHFPIFTFQMFRCRCFSE